AQPSDGGTPLSFTGIIPVNQLQNVPTYHMPNFNNDSLRAEGKRKEKECGCGRSYNAKGEVLDIDIKTAGKKIDITAKGSIWLYQIKSPTAPAIQLLLKDFKVPDGATLYVYNKKKSKVFGAYTSKNNNGSGALTLPQMEGKEFTIEYFEPINAAYSASPKIMSAMHHYRYMFENTRSVYSDNHPALCTDHISANCPIGDPWSIERRSVVAIFGYKDEEPHYFFGYVCSGALMNNTSQDGTPYILSANHCLNYNSYIAP
ncbi:MAG: hypothetical protein M3Q97_09455, partial [Bacteroidota bacterium]|nr:hypothetical protein [Bacteroidota bacterium]